MLYVFEMANNHQGSVDHAKKIVDKFGNLSKKYKLNAAIKLQFRQLGTFIHKDYHKSDLKYVKRFNETKLSKSQFKEIVEYIKDGGMKCMATPFDNESLSWFNDLDIDIVKIASCSIDDWPLLEEVSQINKKIIISTAGAHFDTLKENEILHSCIVLVNTRHLLKTQTLTEYKCYKICFKISKLGFQHMNHQNPSQLHHTQCQWGVL